MSRASDEFLCDWGHELAEYSLPDVPADRGGDWHGSPSRPADSRACREHADQWDPHGIRVPLYGMSLDDREEER